MNPENNPERMSAMAHLRMEQDKKMLYAVKWIAVSEKLIEDKARIIALVKEYLDHVPDENEYLRRKGDELLKQIGGADTGGDREGTPTPGVAGEQTGADDFEWHPGLDLS